MSDDLTLRIGADAKAVVDAMQQMTRAMKGAVDDLKGVNREARAAGEGASGLSGFLKDAAASAAGFVSAQGILRGVGAVLGFVKDSALTMNASLEKTTLQFTTLMGDADGAREHVKDLFEFAKKTPFETGPVIEASKALRTAGGAALDTTEQLRRVGDASAATGNDIGELSRWVGRAYAAIQAGRPFGEAAQRLQEMNVLTPKVRNQLEDLQKTGADGQKVWQRLQQELDRFSGAMKIQEGTWEGVTSTLADTVNLTLADAFKGFFEVARDTIGNVNKLLGDEGLGKALTGVGEALTGSFGVDKQAQVRTMTTLILRFGEGASLSAELAVRGYSGLSATVLGLLTSIATMVEGVAKLNAATLELAASVPGVGRAYEDNARRARDFATFMDGFAGDLRDQTRESVRATVGQTQLTLSLERMREALAKARAGIEATSDQMGPFDEQVKKGGAGLGPDPGSLSAGAKSAAAQLKTLRDKLVDLKAAITAAERNGQPLATILERFGKEAKDAADDAVGWGEQVDGAVQRVADAFKKAELQKALKPFTDQALQNAEKEIEERAKRVQKQYEVDLKRVTERAQAEQQVLDEMYENQQRQRLSALDYTLHVIAKESEQQKRHLEDLGVTNEAVFTEIDRQTAEKMRIAREEHRDKLEAMKKDWESWSGIARAALADLPKLLQAAFTGGGGLKGATEALISGVGSNIGSKLFTGKVGQSITSGVLNTFGMGAATVVGSFLPVIGPALGSLAGKAVSGIAGLFRNKEHEKVNDLRDEFVSAAGGLDALNQRAAAAGKTLDALLRAKTVKDYEAAVKDLESAFAAADQKAQALKDTESQIAQLEGDIAGLQGQLAELNTWQHMEETAKKYGIEIDALGGRYQQLKLNADTQALASGIQELIDGGGDLNGILKGTADEISDIVQRSRKFKLDIPENLRPYIEALAKSGQLLDENGDKITDISDLKFGDPVKTQAEIIKDAMQLLVDKLEELRDVLAKGLVESAKEGVQGVDRTVRNFKPAPITFDVNYNYAEPEPPAPPPDNYVSRGGYVTPGGIQYLAKGGPVAWRPRGTDTVPAMLSPGELVVSRQGVTQAGIAAIQALTEARRATSSAVASLTQPGAGVGMAKALARELAAILPGGDVVVHNRIETWDAGGMLSAVERKLMPALIDAVKSNRGGVRTQLHQLLVEGA